MKTNENKRWELKLAEFKKDVENEENETTNSDTTEHASTRDNATPGWMEEMEKVEAELEEKTNQLKLSEKEKNFFQQESKSKEEKLKELLVEMNKQKTDKLTVKVGLQFKTRKSHRQTGTDQIDNRSSRVGYGVPGKYRKEADLPQTLIGGFLTHNNSISIAT